jgi:hypothetical protein
MIWLAAEEEDDGHAPTTAASIGPCVEESFSMSLVY